MFHMWTANIISVQHQTNKLEVIIYIIKKHFETRQCISLERREVNLFKYQKYKNLNWADTFFTPCSMAKLQTMMLYLPL